MGGTIPVSPPKDCRYGAAVTGEKADNPATLTWATWLLYLEFAGLVALTVGLVVQAARDSALTGPVIGLAVMAALAAVAVFFLAWGLGRRRRGTRGPSMVVQLFVIASGGFLLQVHPVWLGAVMMVLGAVTGLLIVVPPTTRALGIE
jgi:hypothetical protein